MPTIEIPKVRKESDVMMYVSLTDSGVTVDWTSLSEVVAFMYSNEQDCIAGQCETAIAAGDPATLNVRYTTMAPQFLGVNSLLIRCTYDGMQKSFDVPVLEFVDRTAEATGVTTLDDPELPVSIEVTDVDTSLLDEAIAAALDAAAAAAAAAALVPLDVLTQCQEATVACQDATAHASPIIGDNGNWKYYDAETGEYVDSEKPSRGIQGPQGEQGIQGIQGNTGSSVDYPYELVNNLTTDDATKGLSAAQGVALEGEISQLEQEVNGIPYTANKSLKSTGAEIDDAGWAVSDFIPYTSGDAVLWRWGVTSAGSGRCICFYNSSKTFINNGYWTASGNTGQKSITGTEITHDAPGAAFLRISFVPDTDAKVEVGGVTVWKYDAGIEKNLANSLDSKYYDVSKWFNNSGIYIDHDGDAATTSTPSVASTDFLALAPIESFKIAGGRYGSSVALYAFYDKDKQFISGYWSSSDAEVVKSSFPSGAEYIRFTGYDDGSAKLYIYSLADVYFSLDNKKADKRIGVSGVGTMGASLMYPGNNWVQWGCDFVNATAYNKAESGVGLPSYFADKLWRGTYCTDDEFEDMDILAIQFASSGDVFTSAQGFLDTADDYTQDFDIDDSSNQFVGTYNDAQILDYILKYWQEKCYAQRNNSSSRWYGTQHGKPCRFLFVTHWHDARTDYNTAIRQVAEKWGGGLCDFASKIGFSKNQPLTNGTQVSVIYAVDTETIGGVTYGWHPLSSSAGAYIQARMANIFANALRDMSQCEVIG